MLTVILSCCSPKPLEYQSYQNFAIQKFGFRNSTIGLDLIYYNPNHFGLQVKRTDLDIYINGNLLGHTSLDTLIRIGRKDTVSIPVSFDVDMRNVFKNAWNMAAKEVTVRIYGKVKVGKANVFMNIPVDYETQEKFSPF